MTTTAPSVIIKGTCKNKANNKGNNGNDKFNQICNTCGCWGHRASDCLSVLSLEDGNVTLSVNKMTEIVSVDTVKSNAGV
eukprot:5179212-Heterocapsa_arctica.AAC.3